MLMNELQQRIYAARYREEHGNPLTKDERQFLVKYFRAYFKNNNAELMKLPIGFDVDEEYEYIVFHYMKFE